MLNSIASQSALSVLGLASEDGESGEPSRMGQGRGGAAAALLRRASDVVDRMEATSRQLEADQARIHSKLDELQALIKKAEQQPAAPQQPARATGRTIRKTVVAAVGLILGFLLAFAIMLSNNSGVSVALSDGPAAALPVSDKRLAPVRHAAAPAIAYRTASVRAGMTSVADGINRVWRRGQRRTYAT